MVCEFLCELYKMMLVLRIMTHRKHSINARYYYYYVFDKYFLGTYYTSGTVPGTGDKIMKQIGAAFATIELRV